MTNEKLQTFFKFEDADLESNRSGKFSEKQKARLATLKTRERISGKILGILLIGVAVFVLLATPFLYNNPAFLCAGLPVGLIGGVIGIFVLRAKYKNKGYRLRKMQGKVSYARHINSDKHYEENGYWIIHVGKSWFYVPEKVPDILKAGSEYAVYTYAFQGWTYILTAEAVSETVGEPPQPPASVASSV